MLGESGTGKTYSVKTLDPKETYYINCDKKGLPFPGWRTMYNAESKNFARESDAGVIMNLLQGVADKRPEIKNVVIDTLSSIMSDKEMSERKQKGYDEHTCRSKTYLIAGITQEPKFERIRTNGQSAAKLNN